MIGIVVTTWNTLNYLKQMVKTIRTKHLYKLIVVDNASTDGIDEWMKSFPQWHFIKQKSEGSMGRNRNAGMKLAYELGCSHIILSQEDVLFHKDCIDNLIAVHEKRSYILTAAVNIREHHVKQWPIIERMLTEILGYAYKGWEPLDKKAIEQSEKIVAALNTIILEEEYDAPFPVVACIRRDFIDVVGYYDDGYTEAAVEDEDLIHRCNLASGSWENRRAWSCQLSLLFHWGGGCFYTNNLTASPFKKRIYTDSYERYRRKWGGDLNAEQWTTPKPQPSLWNTENTYPKLSRAMEK